MNEDAEDKIGKWIQKAHWNQNLETGSHYHLSTLAEWLRRCYYPILPATQVSSPSLLFPYLISVEIYNQYKLNPTRIHCKRNDTGGDCGGGAGGVHGVAGESAGAGFPFRPCPSTGSFSDPPNASLCFFSS